MSVKEPPHYAGHRQRIREKYLRSGVAGWHDYEVLEFLLSFAIPRKDTKSIAKSLLKRFKSWGKVLDADINILATVKGVSLHTAILLKMCKDVASLYLKQKAAEKDLIASPQAAVSFLRMILGSVSNEEFHALFLDAANHLIASEKIQTGTVNCSSVHPRSVVERALAHHAVGIILVHNHPAGTLKPSEDDARSTSAIGDALATMDISLYDHLIITSNGYFSFKEHHIL